MSKNNTATITRVNITPKMAEEWLRRNVGNRRIRPEHVNHIVRQLLDGDWRVSDSKIMFDTNGNLINGQHRLIACFISGVTLKDVTVEFNVPTDTIQNIDTGWRRSVGDSLRMRTSASAIGRIMMQEEGYEVHTITRPTLMRFINFHREAIEFAIQQFGKKKIAGIGRAAVLSVIASAHYSANIDRLTVFCNILNTGMPQKPEQDSAAILLRNYLIGLDHDEWEIVRRTNICLDAFLNRKAMQSFARGRAPYRAVFMIPVFDKKFNLNKIVQPVFTTDKIPVINEKLDPEAVLQ